MRLAAENIRWQDISRAHGLVHLRATLVDDRYFQWDAAPITEKSDLTFELQFEEADQLVELSIALDSGCVTNSATGRSVPLIPASRRAVAEYLEIVE